MVSRGRGMGIGGGGGGAREEEGASLQSKHFASINSGIQ